MIRDLVLAALNYNIIFRARHIPGLNNTEPIVFHDFR